MSQTACANQYFNNRALIGFASRNIQPTQNHGIDLQISIKRPFLPLWLTQDDPVLGPSFPVPIPYNIQQVKSSIFPFMANSFLQASFDNVAEIIGSDFYLSGDYAQYLYKRVSGPGNDAPYLANYNRIRQFWNAFNLGNTDQQSDEQLSRLVATMKAEGDFDFFLPPGDYKFTAGSDFYGDWEAIFALYPAVTGIFGIEIISI